MASDVDPLRAAASALEDACNGIPGAWERVPVPIRAALAAVALAASGRPANGVTIAAAGRFSRGTAARPDSPWRDLLGTLARNAPGLTEHLLAETEASVDPARLAADVQARDATIAALHADVRTARAALSPIANYAHDLAVELRAYRDHERAALVHLTVAD